MKLWKVVLPLIPVYFGVFFIFMGLLYGSSEMVSVLSEKISSSDEITVIIDAGHGGEDGGASTSEGVLESDINLQIATKLNDLCKFLGIRTVMIRTDDRSVHTDGTTISQKKISDLKERVRICNDANNAILISIHQNYFSDEQYWGTQVFYSDMKESKCLAQRLQAAIISHLQSENNRNIKPAKEIYLMKHIRCPGVLIECGFLSNNNEAFLLQQSEYQNKLCSVIACELTCYLAEATDTLT